MAQFYSRKNPTLSKVWYIIVVFMIASAFVGHKIIQAFTDITIDTQTVIDGTDSQIQKVQRNRIR